MKLFKKSVCILIALIIAFTAIPFAFAEGTSEKSKGALEIAVITNKQSYRTTSSAKITITVTNNSPDTLYNVRAQAVFNDLSPVKEKTNVTTKSVEYLNPGDDFTLAYNVILNSDNYDIGFFTKGLFFFTRLFKKAYFVESVDLSGKNVSTEKVTTEISFGKFTAKNVVEVAFSKTEPQADFTMPEEPATTEVATTESTTAAPAVNVQINNNLQTPPPPTTRYNPPRTTRYEPPRTTRPKHSESYKPTQQRPTKPEYNEPKPSERPATTEAQRPQESLSYEEKVYSAYIDFLEANRNSIGKVDAADLTDDGIYELIFQNLDDCVVVCGYADSRGVVELFRAVKGKGYNMDVYYDTDSNEIVASSADTGGQTYKIVSITNLGSRVTSEIRRNNGKHETGCYQDGVEISYEEFDRIEASFSSKYYIVEGSVSQLIPILERSM